eukprot:s1192_g12.t1
MVSGACLGTHSVPTSELVNRPLHVVVIKLLAAMLDASPFGLRLFLSAEAVSESSVGLRLAPTVHVRALRLPKRFDLSSQLLETIGTADVDAVARLLSEGQCPNQPGESGLLPRYAALNRKNVVASSALIQARANLDELFDFGGTALHLACRQNLPTAWEGGRPASSAVKGRRWQSDTRSRWTGALRRDLSSPALLGAETKSSRRLFAATPLRPKPAEPRSF